MKELTLKEHLKRIQSLGGKARWEGVKRDPEYFRELNRKSQLAKKIKKEIEEESKRNIEVEALKEMINN